MTTMLRLPSPVAENWDWQRDAACRGMDVEVFYHPPAERRSTKQRRIEQAKTICAGCPVLEQCRRQALTTREPYGVWGGLSEEDRADLLGVNSLRYPGGRRRRRLRTLVLADTSDAASPT